MASMIPAPAVPSPDRPADAARISDARTAVRRPRLGQWALAVIVAAIVAWCLYAIATNPVMEWDVVLHYFTVPSVLRGLGMTIQLTVVAMVLGILGGILLAVMRMSSNRLLKAPADLYVWFFRGTPVLVQLIFWYNIAIFVPQLTIAIPFGPELVTLDTNSVVTPFVASILGLALNEAAYMCEIVRGGLLSVPHGQREAAQTLGLGRMRTLTRIVLPQAMPAIVPPTGNQVISMLKGTSLVSVIAMNDLLYSVQAVYNQSYKVIPLLVVACLWYLIATTILNIVQTRIERHYGRGSRR